MVWFTMAENYNHLEILPPAYKEGNLLIKRDINNFDVENSRLLKRNSAYCTPFLFLL